MSKRHFVIELEIDEDSDSAFIVANCCEVERLPYYDDSGNVSDDYGASLILTRYRSYNPDFMRGYWFGQVCNVLHKAFIGSAEMVKLWDPPFGDLK